jgi:hypothetical protein
MPRPGAAILLLSEGKIRLTIRKTGMRLPVSGTRHKPAGARGKSIS